MKAYDVEMLPRQARQGSESEQGWCFGLPPGITSEQWPLDPENGYPLMHGFTLLLPPDYRVHGEEFVALSFFATPAELNDGGPTTIEPIAQAFAASDRPDDPDLVPFWSAAQNPHPRLSRMTDILGCHYAVILLTQAEFEGPSCSPPRFVGNPHLDEVTRPRWLDVGGALASWESVYSPALDLPPERYGVFKQFGQIPDADPAFNRALKLTPRTGDPNAGKAVGDPDYVDQLDENYAKREWANDLQPNHLGGTMSPFQQAPDFSPYYIEFEEWLGGYNFGGGNAQLDFRDMRFDWACG